MPWHSRPMKVVADYEMLRVAVSKR